MKMLAIVIMFGGRLQAVIFFSKIVDLVQNGRSKGMAQRATPPTPLKKENKAREDKSFFHPDLLSKTGSTANYVNL